MAHSFLTRVFHFLAAAVVLGAGLPGLVQAHPALPVPLSVGSSVVVLQALGSGVQIYTCKAQADHGYAWVLKAPDAVLSGSDGGKIGRHYAGPTWEATDGSKVVGKVAASAAAPGAVPWLLLTASPTGRGRFSEVTYVERVFTSGGLAPKTGADAAHVGAEVRVPYTATYLFYGPADRRHVHPMF
jgi:hypothetical protein